MAGYLPKSLEVEDKRHEKKHSLTVWIEIKRAFDKVWEKKSNFGVYRPGNYKGHIQIPLTRLHLAERGFFFFHSFYVHRFQMARK